MIFTTKAEYGVRLLIQLGLQGGGAPVSLKAVADAENLPLAYLERIAALLKKAELVQATRGAHGGYVLARPAEEITMDAVVLALEGAIAPMDCFIDDRESRVLCSHLSDGEHCATKLLWTRVQMGVIKSLQRTTLQELVDFASPQREHPGDTWLTSRSRTFTSPPGTSRSSRAWISTSAPASSTR